MLERLELMLDIEKGRQQLSGTFERCISTGRERPIQQLNTGKRPVKLADGRKQISEHLLLRTTGSYSRGHGTENYNLLRGLPEAEPELNQLLFSSNTSH